LRQVGRFIDAERVLRHALDADPSLARAHLELVNLYRQQNRKEDVITELQTFLKLFPSDPLAPQVKETLVRLGVAVPPK
jgi:tetratricopeptide (TPR) repeat protein